MEGIPHIVANLKVDFTLFLNTEKRDTNIAKGSKNKTITKNTLTKISEPRIFDPITNRK
jgi:hypothetical protein